MTIIEGMSNADYHASEGISKSGLDLIARSPAHFRYAPAKESTRPMEIGTAIHTAILEPERFTKEYMLLRDVKVRTASEYKQAAKIYTGERTLTSTESDNVVGMQQAVWSNNEAKLFLGNEQTKTEVSIFTTDPVTGVKVKCRFDALLGIAGMDVKKTEDCRPDQFIRSVWNYRYHVQHAFYCDVFEWETGERMDDFRFLAIEDNAPNANKIYRLPHDLVSYGRKLYREALNTYADCLESGHWPSHDGSTEVLNPLAWMLAVMENEADEAGMTFGDE